MADSAGPPPPPDLDAITAAIVEVMREVVRAEEAAVPAAPEIKLPEFFTAEWVIELIERARLDHVAVTIVRVMLAAELEPTASRALLRLSAHPNRPGVPVDAMVVTLKAFGISSIDVLHALRPTAPLRQRGLVQVHGDVATQPLKRHLTMPSRLVDYLLTGTVPPPLTQPLLQVEPARLAAELCPVPARDDGERASVADRLRRALPAVLDGEGLWLAGPTGSGRKTVLATIAAEFGCRLLVLSAEDALAALDDQLVATLWRELLLGTAILCIADADSSLTSHEVHGAPVRSARGNADVFGALYGVVRRADLPVVFTSDQPPSTQDLDQPPAVLRIGRPTPADTLALWRRSLPEAEAIEEISTGFKLPPGRIVRTAASARRHAAAFGRTAISHRDVAQAISVAVAQQVAVLGTLVEDTQGWDDIVMPDDVRDSVRELIARVRHRHTVLDAWGFRAKMAKGLGMAALFSGPPGTGKTMIASIIARELGQELYQIDLSRVVSKWIGETEKNLAKVFDAAEGANVLLLFDEADSLFAKRTEVKSSNDRHSNAEVNYLLQRVERFEGICILTTNFEGSIDPAFKRRLAFRMNFPLPDEADRAELWKRMLPPMAEVSPDVDFVELGEQYELAGGHIRNAVLRAAFLAASERTPITRELLTRAVRLEYRDAGKFTTVGRIT